MNINDSHQLGKLSLVEGKIKRYFIETDVKISIIVLDKSFFNQI